MGRWRWSAPLHRLTAGALARREEKGWIKRELDPRGWFHWCASAPGFVEMQNALSRASLLQAAGRVGLAGVNPYRTSVETPCAVHVSFNRGDLTWSCSIDHAV